MPFLDLAGTPAVRFPDPNIKRVIPNGSQPYTAYQAVLVFGIGAGEYDALLRQPPDSLVLQLLLFGADYPVKICGVQQFEQQVYDTTGALFPIQDLTFPLLPPSGTALADALPTLLPSLTFDPYKKIATGATATNGVVVSGYPALSFVSGRNLFATESGDEGDRAAYAVCLDVTLNGAVVDGPAPYGAFVTGSANTLLPVILNEADLTQEIVDNGYIIENVLVGAAPASLNVVGLWQGFGYTPPPPPRLGARAFGASPAGSVSVQDRITAVLAEKK